MNPKFLLYHHKNLALANYALECSPYLKAAAVAGDTRVIHVPADNSKKEFAALPTALRRLLFFARPDLVICIDDGVQPIRPIFAFELTDHVPAQDHWMQRFNHLVGCAQEGVPGAYILPFAMPNHPTFPSALDHVFFFAYDRVTEIHGTAVFIAEWEVVGGTLPKCDSTYASLPDRSSPDIRLTFRYLERVIDSAVHGRQLSELNKERLFVDLRNRVRKRAYRAIPEIKNFARLEFNCPNNRPLTTKEFSSWLTKKGLKLPPDMPDRICKRDKYLIFVPQAKRGSSTVAQLRTKLMTRIQDKGGDPYLGQPLAFDYMFCRLGPTPFERDCSLVIDLSVLKFADMAEYHRKAWKSSPLQHTSISKISDVPTYTMHLKEGASQIVKNVLRIYAFAADAIVYEDGIIYF